MLILLRALRPAAAEIRYCRLGELRLRGRPLPALRVRCVLPCCFSCRIRSRLRRLCLARIARVTCLPLHPEPLRLGPGAPLLLAVGGCFLRSCARVPCRAGRLASCSCVRRRCRQCCCLLARCVMCGARAPRVRLDAWPAGDSAPPAPVPSPLSVEDLAPPLAPPGGPEVNVGIGSRRVRECGAAGISLPLGPQAPLRWVRNRGFNHSAVHSWHMRRVSTIRTTRALTSAAQESRTGFMRCGCRKKSFLRFAPSAK